MRKPTRAFDCILFDIDNVLVDTRFSYTDCIRETVQICLERTLKLKPSRTLLLSRKDIEHFKLLGGFNDDWDTCYGLLLYLLSLQPKISSLGSLKKLIRLKKLLKTLRTPVSVKGIERWCGKNKQVSLKHIARIFQKLYWSTYIRKESAVLPKKTMFALASRGFKIGIATGRSRREAVYVLKRFGIATFIGKIIGVDDLPSKRLKKPNPFSLLSLARHFGKNLRYVYVGDLPDDIRTAVQARSRMTVTAWGFSALSLSRREMNAALKRAGADRILQTPTQLNRALQAL